uniref:Uncharacterized protein n=1 Tax=Candidatus Kentrum eta TaxID=2126337 RepID=A0A450USG0_9GAMM|nr:MAG: hypothetical protein BECKH772A_GA0070896_1000119 [Candidatus Kentron sp. H]VFJ88178.1 MAG: hypothetical protein BECKH772B_GA0070898_1000110 [Candidatus Kentron sp. H]VFJ95400.1 MAG: hypothetical protein BECKH772C_GA0070978_1000219 [Candidatus Kentron sp. H]
MFEKKNSENIVWVIPFLIYAIYLFVILSYGHTDTYYASFGLHLSFLDNPAEIYFFHGLKAFVVKEPRYGILAMILALSGLPFIAFVQAKKINRRLLDLSETQEAENPTGISGFIRKHGNPVKWIYWTLFVGFFFSLFVFGTLVVSKLGENHARRYISDEIDYADSHRNPYARRQLFEPNKVVFLTKRGGEDKESCYRLLHMDSSGLYVYPEPAQYKLIEKDTNHQDPQIVNVDLLFFPAVIIERAGFGDRLLADEKCIPEGWQSWKDWRMEFSPKPGLRIRKSNE